MTSVLTLRVILAAALALFALFLGPILVSSLWLRLGVIVIALLLIAEGSLRLRRLRKREE